MRDVEDLIRALEGPEPAAAAPPWPVEPAAGRRRSARWAPGLAVGLALAAGVLLVWTVQRADPDAPQVRGVPAAAPVALDLRMVVERGGIAVRASADTPLRVGERVLFRASADRAIDAELWVRGPPGRERIAAVALDAVPRDVGGPTGLVGYRFDAPGRYAFTLTAADADCAPCGALVVEVRP